MLTRFSRRPLLSGSTFALVALLVCVAQSASAQFFYTAKFAQEEPEARGFTPVPATGQAPPPPLSSITTPNGTPLAFSLPSKLFSQMFTGVGAFPGYPYFKYTGLRYVKQGDFEVSYHPVSTTTTFVPTNIAYPFASLTPAPGFVRRKFGPNGFGGDAPAIISSYFKGIITGGIPGASNFTALLTFTRSGSFLPADLGGYSIGAHQTLTTGNGAPVTNNKVFKLFAAPLMTGNATMYNPAPFAATYLATSALDNRNPAGTSGTIQLIQPGLAYGYGVLPPQPPPLDGSRPVTDLQIGTITLSRFTVTVPEPARFALISAGFVALGGLFYLRRR